MIACAARLHACAHLTSRSSRWPSSWRASVRATSAFRPAYPHGTKRLPSATSSLAFRTNWSMRSSWSTTAPPTRTVAVATEAGARVVTIAPPGKGAAMHRGLQSRQPAISSCTSTPTFATSKLTSSPAFSGRCSLHDDISLVKGTYARPTADGPRAGGGSPNWSPSRCFDCCSPMSPRSANRLLVRWRPGACSSRSSPSPRDTPSTWRCCSTRWRRSGAEGVAEVDLGVHVHRNRPLAELAPQAEAIMQAVLERVDQRK